MLTLSFLEILYVPETDRTNPIANVKNSSEEIIVECMKDTISTTSASNTKDSMPGSVEDRKNPSFSPAHTSHFICIQFTIHFHPLTLRSPHHHHGFSTLWKQSIRQPSRNPFPNHDANALTHRRCTGEKHIDRADSPVHQIANRERYLRFRVMCWPMVSI